MKVWDSKQNKLVDIPDNQYTQLVGDATPPPTTSQVVPTAQPTSQGTDFLGQEQQRYQDAIKRAVTAQDYNAQKSLTDTFKSNYGFDPFAEAPQTTAEKQKQADIKKLQAGPKKVTTAGPLSGIPIIGNLGKKETYQYYNPDTQQIETAPNLEEAVSAINTELSSLGSNPLNPTDVANLEKKNPGMLEAAYNLTFKPIVEGAKGYGELLGTAAGSITLGALNAIDPTQKYTMDVQQNIAKALTPVVTQKYDNPVDTITNGVFQTIGGIGAAAQIYILGTAGLAMGSAKLVGLNLAFNSGLYGTGGAIEAAKSGGSASQGFVSGALGFTTTGPITAIAGDTSQNRMIDNIIGIVAPLFYGKVKGILDEKVSTPGATPPENLPEMQKGIVPSIKGSLYRFVTASADPKDMAKSEAISRKVLQETSGEYFKRDIGIRLKENINTAGDFIDKSVEKTSAQIGPMVGDEVLGEIEQTLRQTPEGHTNPEGVDYVLKEIEKRLDNGLPSPSGNVDEFGTTVIDENGARKYLNTQTRSWFKSGARVVSDADKIHQLEHIADQVLKKHLVDTNPTIGNALDIQSTSIPFYEVMAKQAGKPGFIGGLYRMYLATIHSLLGPPLTAVARTIAGPAPAEIQSILSGKAPELPVQLETLPLTPEETVVVKSRMENTKTTTPIGKTPPATPSTTTGVAVKGRTLNIKPSMPQDEAFVLLNKVPEPQRTRLVKELSSLGDITPRQKVAKLLLFMSKKKFQ